MRGGIRGEALAGRPLAGVQCDQKERGMDSGRADKVTELERRVAGELPAPRLAGRAGPAALPAAPPAAAGAP